MLAPIDEPFPESTGAHDYEPSIGKGEDIDTREDVPDVSSTAENTRTTAVEQTSTMDPSSTEDESSISPQISSESTTTQVVESEASSDSSSDVASTTESEQSEPEQEAVEIDPTGPQFGYRLELELKGPLNPNATYRTIVFNYEASNSVANSPIRPRVRIQEQLPHQARLPFNSQGRAAVILPTPALDQLDRSTGRSRPHAVTVYHDVNNDGLWSQNEPFVAALTDVLYYVAGTQDAPERWERIGELPFVTVPDAPLQPLPKSPLALRRLDSNRGPGTPLFFYEDGLGTAVNFVTFLSTAEMEDLESNFLPVPPVADVALRTLPENKRIIQLERRPKLLRRSPPFIEIPGIRPSYMTTLWIAGYMRPLGASLSGPGEFLTPDSTLLASACYRGKPVIAVWLDEDSWASGPEGALYAAWLSLGVGWGFVPVDTERVPGLQVVCDQETINANSMDVLNRRQFFHVNINLPCSSPLKR